MEAYSNIADNDKFSYTLAMKKILNMTEDEIEENDRMLDIESEKQAVREYWAEKVAEYGSREKAEKAIAQEEQEDSEEDDSLSVSKCWGVRGLNTSCLCQLLTIKKRAV